MSVLSAEEFATRLSTFIGENTSKDAMDFMADSLDTVNALTKEKGESKEYWENKLKENDETWRKRFMNRFYSGIAGNPGAVSPTVDAKQPEPTAESIGFTDLFK